MPTNYLWLIVSCCLFDVLLHISTAAQTDAVHAPAFVPPPTHTLSPHAPSIAGSSIQSAKVINHQPAVAEDSMKLELS